MSDPEPTETTPDAPRVRVVGALPVDWERMRALRLAALADAPDAFAATLAGERDRPDDFWRGRLERADVTTLRAELRGDDGGWRDAGLAVLAPTDEAAVVGLYSVWVAPTARGRGVGDALLEAAVARAAALGYARVALEVGAANAPAIGLYARAGFRATGRTGTLPAPRGHSIEIEMARELGA
jgi:ribosomal protein S18 acetylase RimI-like enzyme